MKCIIINNELYIPEEFYEIETKDKSIYEIYYNTIKYYPILKEEEVKYLFDIYYNDKNKINREKAKQDLINCHLKLVCKYAHKYSSRTKRLDLNDLIQEGNIILLKTIETYKEKNTIPFVAYLCSMLKYGLLNIIYNDDRLFRVPANIIADYNKIRKTYDFLNKYNKNKKITFESLVKASGLTEKRIKKALKLVQDEIYLDKPLKEDESGSRTIGDIIIDSTALELHEKLIESELKKDFKEALSSLTQKEKNIMIQVIEMQHRNINIEKIALENFMNKKQLVEVQQKAIKKLRQNQKVASYA